jgi:carboxymethylenebutenolidase
MRKMGAGRMLRECILEIKTKSGIMGVLSSSPDGELAPLVIMFHDGPGVREATWEAMRRFSSVGFRVLCPDRYNRFGQFVHFSPEDLMQAGKGSELMSRFFDMVTATTDEIIAEDIAALLKEIAPEEPFACVGFCNGVRSLLRTLHDYKQRGIAGIGFHPSFCIEDGADSPHLAVPEIEGLLYLAFGEDDHISSIAHNRPLIDAAKALGSRAEIVKLPKAGHGFAMPGPSYASQAAEEAYSDAIGILQRAFGICRT